MLERLNRGWIPVLIIAQAAGLAIWWTWFNQLAFGTTYLLGWTIHFIIFACLFGLWYYTITMGIKRYTSWDAQLIGKLDSFAGSPLILLPFLIPISLLLIKGLDIYPMKLISAVWFPTWHSTKALGASAYISLMLGGILILGSLAWKLVIVLKQVYKNSLPILKPMHLFVLGFVILLILCSWPAIVAVPNQGEVSQLLVTQALSYDMAFHVEGVLDRGEFFRFYPIQDIFFNGYVDGLSRLFLPVAPGMPLLFITFYLIAGRWFISVLVMLFAAGAASHLFGLLREQGYQRSTSFVVWAISLMTAPLLLYGYQIMEVTASVFFLSWGLRLLMRIPKLEKAEVQSHAAIIGLIAGLIWLGGVRFIGPSIILIVLLTYQLFKIKQLKALIGASITLFVPVLFASIYFLNIYGIFFYHPVYQFNQIWALEFWTNFLAMFSDRATGLLWHGPIWLLGLAGTIWMALQKRNNILAITILALIGALVLFGLIMPDPRAEGSSMNRLLASVIPLTGLGLAWIIEQVNENHWLKKMTKFLASWSIGLAVLLTMLPDLTNEAVRLKLLSWLKIDFLYNYLPSFGDQSSMMQLLVAIIICLLVSYFIYKVIEQLTIIKKLSEK